MKNPYQQQTRKPGYFMQAGGMPQEMMPPQEAPMPEEGGDQMNQVMQAVAQMLQQGMAPEEVMQKLVEMGVPQDQAQQIIQQVMQQMQGGQQQQAMRMGGYFRK